MKLFHFNVSQIRVAATCPRLHWFDSRANFTRLAGSAPAISRIWRGSDQLPGGGALFHRAVERFNANAATAPEILAALEDAEDASELQQYLLTYFNANCIKLEVLAEKPIGLRIAFISALQGYMNELAMLAMHARVDGESAEAIRHRLFADNRKRVDVTFHVADDTQVHVTGAIDYVFYDARIGRHRIFDYKLTPADAPNNDLFQIYTYALMHHHQHGTQPDVALFYLHPERHVIEAPWERVIEHRARVYDIIASMVAWAEHAVGLPGLLPPGDTSYCGQCKHERAGSCASVLGPKSSGEWDRRWRELGTDRRSQPGLAVSLAPKAAESEDEDDPELQAADEVLPEPARQKPDGASLHRVTGPSEKSTNPAPHSAAPRTFSEGEAGRLVVGRTRDGRNVTLDASVLRTHVSVVGAAGSGKTWMAKILAEEALRAGVPVLAIDPQGDLVQMIGAREESEVPDWLRPAYREFHELVEPHVYTPGSSHGTRMSLDPLRLPAEADLAHIESRERREEERSQVIGAVAANLVSLAGGGGEGDAQRAFLYRVLDSFKKTDAVGIRDVVDALAEPEAIGLDEAEVARMIRKPERERLARRLNAFVYGPTARLFEGGTKLDMSELIKPATPGRVRLNVIYLNALTDDQQKHFFLAALATEIYRWMITSVDASSGGVNLLFYLDEARDWIPAGGSKPAAKDPLIRLFTQGRKYGVGCLICTQSPRSVDYGVFGNTSTKFIGRLEAAQDMERVKDWFTNDGGAPPWVPARNGADRGSFVARWPEMPDDLSGVAFEGRTLFTPHAGAWSPDRLERQVDQSGLRGK